MSGHGWGGEAVIRDALSGNVIGRRDALEGRRMDSRRDYVKGVLDDALVIVAELDVPKDLAPVALAKAIDLLARTE